MPKIHCQLVDFTCEPNVRASLTLGYLQAFAQADPRLKGSVTFASLCRYMRDKPREVLSKVLSGIEARPRARHVVGFTNYFWNKPLNLDLANSIKAQFPATLIVFGGNEVTNQGELMLDSASPVDVIANGEGEAVFANLLAAYGESAPDFQTVQGISFRSTDGRVITTSGQPRIECLDSIPSPFQTVSGMLDTVADSRVIMYEFSRGCPFHCAFCFWGGAVGTKTRRFSLDRIQTDLEIIISAMQRGARLYVADANFGMVQADVDVAHLIVDIVRRKQKRIFLFTNWAKNTTPRVVEVASILFGVDLIKSVQLSAQSLNKEVLAIAQRSNIRFEYYRSLQKEFQQRRIPTFTELLLGMPGESYESFLHGIDNVISAGGTPIIYPLLLLNNTEYNTPEFLAGHQVRSRLMPYEMHDPSVRVSTVIGHAVLSYKDWLRGITLRLAVPVFHGALLKFLCRRLHDIHGISYFSILDCLVEYCLDRTPRVFPAFWQLFWNYIDSWDCPANYNPDLIRAALGSDTPRESLHYHAIMKVIAADVEGARALVRECAGILAARFGHRVSEPFNELVEYQEIIVDAVCQAINGMPGEVVTALSAARVRKFAGGSIGREERSMTVLRVKKYYYGAPSDVVAFRISYGSIDTLDMFETTGAEDATQLKHDSLDGLDSLTSGLKVLPASRKIEVSVTPGHVNIK
jgi:radical SAM superfamily enzyme YgiQ (UPF0313 family)